MDEQSLARIEQDPDYRLLVARRTRFGWLLAGIVAAAFFAFIALIAFDKAALATPIGDGVTTVGIPVGLGLILLAILLTAAYVVRANREYDRLLAGIVERAGR
jgi:uncharacterized membrane protein (DUF485 family)